MKEIVQKENKVLRQVAKEIPIKDIASKKIQKVLKEMSESLASQDDGVALAAPQIGYSLQIFIIAGKVFDKDFINDQMTEEERKNKIWPKDKVFINPKITKLSKEKMLVPEGCLSVRWLYGNTNRHKKATVEAYDENGKFFIMGASGLISQIFQHETDHLKGVLFSDHAKELKEERQ